MALDERVIDLLLRYEEQCANGRPPNPEDLCRDCPELLDEVRRRIEHLHAIDHFATSGRLAPTADPPTVASPSEGTARERQWDAAGLRYRPLHFHAEGGLGEVWVAQDDELNRQVALKRIRPDKGPDNPGARRRFLLEAEIAGRLEHPGVVPVHGLGYDAQGQPCYAMRLIRGETLADAAKAFHEAGTAGRDPGQRRLAFRDLLGRFAAACKTVAYAHSRGVIHRDLKPGNIMLGPYGETLVVDWGLAKPVEQVEGPAAGGEDTVTPTRQDEGETVAGVPLGSPAYMSPEQADGRWDEVGPASDIYSLGATLYTLLTGKAPRHGRRQKEMLRQAREGAFRPPRQVKRDVPRPLEAVCLKAMAPRPEDRYATALDLAADVDRWLADEPVRAYREPWALRARRWVRRHRPLVTAAMAAVVALALSLGVASVFLASAYDRERTFKQQAESAYEGERIAKQQAQDRELQANLALEGERQAKDQAQRAEKEAKAKEAQAKQASDFLASLFQVSDPIGLNGYPFHLAWEKGMDLKASEILARAVKKVKEVKDPLLRATQLDVMGNVYRSMAQYDVAEDLLREAYKIRLKERGEGHPEVADSMFNLGWLQHDRGNYEAAKDWYRKALRVRLDLEHAPEESDLVASTKLNLAWVLTENGEYDEAEPLFREVIRVYALLHTEQSREVAVARAGLAALLLDQGQQGRLAEAGLLIMQAADAFARVDGEETPSKALSLFQKGIFALRKADLLGKRLGGPYLQEAGNYLGQCVWATGRWLGNDHPWLAVVLHDYAIVQWRLDKPEVAEEYFRACLATAQRAVSFAHPRAAIGVRSFGDFCIEQNKPDEAEPFYDYMIQARAQRFGVEHAYVADAHRLFGDFLFRRAESGRALEEYRMALDLWRKQPTRPAEFALTCANAGALALNAGRVAEAEQLCREGQDAYKKLARADKGGLGAVTGVLGRVLLTQARYADADAQLAEARRLLQDAGKARELDLLVALVFSARLAAAKGRFDEAESLYRQAVPLAATHWSKRPADRAAVLEEYGGALMDVKKCGEAAAAFEEAAEVHRQLSPAGGWNAVWRCRQGAALARLADGDGAAYRDFCRQAGDQLGKSPDAATLASLAWLLVLTGDAGAGGDAVALAERALRADDVNVFSLLTGGPAWNGPLPGVAVFVRRNSFYRLCQGAALYRAGRYADAARGLEALTERPSENGTGYAWLFLSLAYNRLGRADDAHRAFERAAGWMKSVNEPDPGDANAVRKIGWQDRLSLGLLFREAEQALAKP
jgi:tetratricopeptide (TPR) repeat protein